MHLYELSKAYIDLAELLDQTSADEIDDSVRLAFNDVSNQASDKVESIVKVIKGFERLSQARLDEAAELKARSQHAANVADRLKEYLKHHVEQMEPDTKKMAAGLFNVSVVNNGGKQPVVFNESVEVPTRWCKATWKPDLDLIRKHLLAGDPLGFAQLTERGTHLRIR